MKLPKCFSMSSNYVLLVPATSIKIGSTRFVPEIGGKLMEAHLAGAPSNANEAKTGPLRAFFDRHQMFSTDPYGLHTQIKVLKQQALTCINLNTARPHTLHSFGRPIGYNMI